MQDQEVSLWSFRAAMIIIRIVGHICPWIFCRFSDSRSDSEYETPADRAINAWLMRSMVVLLEACVGHCVHPCATFCTVLQRMRNCTVSLALYGNGRTNSEI